MNKCTNKNKTEKNRMKSIDIITTNGNKDDNSIITFLTVLI